MPNRNPLFAFMIAVAFWAAIIATVVLTTGCKTIYTEPVTATNKDFQEVVSEYDFTVIVFGADWCPACRSLKPVVAELAKTYAGQIKVVEVNTDTTKIEALGYDFQYIPYVVIRKGGKDVYSGNLEDLDHINRLVAKELGVK